jgi:hypothetical protein
MIRNSGSIMIYPHHHVDYVLLETVKRYKKSSTNSTKRTGVSVRSLAKEYEISKSSTHRILKKDLGLYAYKQIIGPKLTEEHKDTENVC